MSHPKHPADVMRIFIACSPTYRNRRAIMEALGSIFIDTIEQQREYYYLDCPAMDEIFDDGVFNRAIFHQFVPNDRVHAPSIQRLKFAYVVAGGDDAFIAKAIGDINSQDAMLVRLA
ncbi:MAG TPA: hypothetical protein PKE16_04140 [Hyphomicrobium sp.]|nr:hypothetical protein [Hyphomicrobium sp.]